MGGVGRPGWWHRCREARFRRSGCSGDRAIRYRCGTGSERPAPSAVSNRSAPACRRPPGEAGRALRGADGVGESGTTTRPAATDFAAPGWGGPGEEHVGQKEESGPGRENHTLGSEGPAWARPLASLRVTLVRMTPGSARVPVGVHLGLNFPKSCGSMRSRYSFNLSASSEGLGTARLPRRRSVRAAGRW